MGGEGNYGSLVFNSLPQDGSNESLMTLSDKQGKTLMDDLWCHGFRPSSVAFQNEAKPRRSKSQVKLALKMAETIINHYEGEEG